MSNIVPVPQGTKTNELRALIRRHRAELLDDTVSGSAASAFGAATSKAGNEYAKATNDASLAAQEAFNEAVDTWSDSRLKAYLDARGIPVPQASKTDELRALVRKNSHKAASGFHAWTWDDFSYDNLKSYLVNSGNDAAKKVGESTSATRDELVSAAQSAYSSASSAGGPTYASVTSYLAQATDSVKESAFDTWSESELKSYLDSYGIVSFHSKCSRNSVLTMLQPVHQGSTLNELRAQARKQSTYFKYGTTTPTGTAFAKLSESVKDTYQWVMGQLGAGAGAAKKKAEETKNEL